MHQSISLFSAMSTRLASLVLFLLLLLLLLLLQASSPPAAAASSARPDIVNATCNLSAQDDPNVNYTFCVDALRSVSRSKHADLRGLALVSLKLAKTNAKRAKSQTKALLKAERKQMSEYKKSCLETCRELYADSADSLKSAARLVKARQYGDAKVYISSAVDSPGDCEDAFGEGGIASPLTSENYQLFELAVIALAITSRLSNMGMG